MKTTSKTKKKKMKMEMITNTTAQGIGICTPRSSIYIWHISLIAYHICRSCACHNISIALSTTQWMYDHLWKPMKNEWDLEMKFDNSPLSIQVELHVVIKNPSQILSRLQAPGALRQGCNSLTTIMVTITLNTKDTMTFKRVVDCFFVPVSINAWTMQPWLPLHGKSMLA